MAQGRFAARVDSIARALADAGEPRRSGAPPGLLIADIRVFDNAAIGRPARRGPGQ